MSDWSLSVLLAGLHDDIQRKLETVRQSFGHPGTKGDASEKVWLELLDTYLPKRYQAATAHVVDSKGVFSDQIDVVVFDRQYSPFIFYYQGQTIIPAESVYAVFEAKQAINAARTSLPIPHAGGTYPAKPLIPILGGILTFESDWIPRSVSRSTTLSRRTPAKAGSISAASQGMGISAATPKRAPMRRFRAASRPRLSFSS
jgi:hypothetical protein